MEGKKKTASGTEKEAALAELDRVERELAELGPDPALEADKKSNAVLDKGKTRPLKEVKYPVAVSASELKKMEIPQIVWIVDRLLPVGVSMIGAPSKYFKSYMALGLCLAVCTGEKFLSFQCNKYTPFTITAYNPVACCLVQWAILLFPDMPWHFSVLPGYYQLCSPRF